MNQPASKENKSSKENNLTGVVLCGGESKRMGRDKGLLPKDGTPWAVYMAAKLTALDIPVVFSINQRQWDSYSLLVPSGQLIVDSLDLPGPLNGLLSVHKTFPTSDLLLIACDMLDMDQETLHQLIEVYRSDRLHDFFAYADFAFMQPFCAIYTEEGLSGKLYAILEQDNPFLSLQSLLKKGRTKELEMERPGAFANYNTDPLRQEG